MKLRLPGPTAADNVSQLLLLTLHGKMNVLLYRPHPHHYHLLCFFALPMILLSVLCGPV